MCSRPEFQLADKRTTQARRDGRCHGSNLKQIEIKKAANAAFLIYTPAMHG